MQRTHNHIVYSYTRTYYYTDRKENFPAERIISTSESSSDEGDCLIAARDITASTTGSVFTALNITYYSKIHTGLSRQYVMARIQTLS